MLQDTTQPVGDSFLGMNSEASGDEVAASAPQGGALISDFLRSPSFLTVVWEVRNYAVTAMTKGLGLKQRSEDRGREMRRILTEEECLCPRDEHMLSALGT